MSESGYIPQAADGFRDVFIGDMLSGIPTDSVFVPRLAERFAFYSPGRQVLTHDQYDAVVGAARSLGEESFQYGYIGDSVESVFPADFLVPVHGVVSVTWDIAAFRKEMRPMLDHALWSASGRWGIYVSRDDYALVGGDPAFAKEVKRRYPDWAEDTRRLARAAGYEYDQTPDWQELMTAMRRVPWPYPDDQ